MKNTGNNLFFYVLESHICLQLIVVNYTEDPVFSSFLFFFSVFLVDLHIFSPALLDVVACCLSFEWFI